MKFCKKIILDGLDLIADFFTAYLIYKIFTVLILGWEF